jgi:hypothetical protein
MMTSTSWLLLSVMLQAALTVGVGARLGAARFRAGRAGQVKVADIAVDGSRWPDEVRKLANNYQNQFEAPVLLYALVPLLLVTGLADSVGATLAWLFVAFRIVHAVEHTGRNKVIVRFRFFLGSVICVSLMWIWFALRYFVIG